MSQRAPTVLLIMADQMAARALPVYGHPVVKAPYLTALADGGVVFESAYCNSPLCAPSRYVLMTGQLPSKIGAYDNAAEFPADIPTFAHYLRAANYQTALSGKMHFCGPDQLHGFEQRLTTDIYPADYGWFPNWDEPDVRPSWYHNMSSVTQAGPCVRTNQLDFDDEVVFHAKRYLYDYVRSDRARPFCLTVSLTHPHDPYAITEEYWNRYTNEQIDLPKVSITHEDQDPHSRRLQAVYQLPSSEVGEQAIRNARRAYYGAISYVDEQIGSLLTTLKACGLEDNTVIIFCGDHGDMLGERNLWYKMTFFEDSARVPLIVHYPKWYTPKRVGQSVSTIDLLPTLLEMATGQEPETYPMPIQGRSLVPHLLGRADAHDEVFGEYFAEGALAPIFMIRRGAYKYIHCPLDPDQLYHLGDDPLERVNLATHSRYQTLCAQFRQEALARWDVEQLTQAVLTSQRRRRLIVAALASGAKYSWDHQPQFNASEMYMRNHIDLDDLEARARYPKP